MDTLSQEDRARLREICEAGVIGHLLKALEDAETERDALYKELDYLVSESRGVVGLHRNGDIASWDWLTGNAWMATYASMAKKRPVVSEPADSQVGS
jgi:hypothetical protein